MAVAKAYMVTSIPFVLAKAGTGIVSLLTGLLSIQPMAGTGTAVDLAILIGGLVVTLCRALRKAARELEGSEGAHPGF